MGAALLIWLGAYYGGAMATVIASEETLRSLIEAHASLAAWYYQMSDALRAAGAAVDPPSEEQRRRYVEQLASHFPELASVARAIVTPRPYIPPPAVAPPALVDPSTVKYE